MKNPFEKYTGHFTVPKFWAKLQRFAVQAGTKTVYSALLLFFAYRRKETPAWAKNIVLGTLGYLLTPFDALPDLTPIIGYTDDLGVLTFGLVTIAGYINEDVREKAKKQLGRWFRHYDEQDLLQVDQKL
ncbi:MAG: DUF1232 domain-containing protein [Phaeodactylibacter sp.]|nr:DUF1232 domain-containing protein [Phaeodactylibacter sp.]MCB9273099.1 DUF1232 domain-containing protein [Lewinellaceae bacterium]